MENSVVRIQMQLLFLKKREKILLMEIHGGGDSQFTSGGPLKINRTIEEVRHRFYWPQIRQDVEQFCQICADCDAKNPTRSQELQFWRSIRKNCNLHCGAVQRTRQQVNSVSNGSLFQ